MDALTIVNRLVSTSSRLDKEQILFDAFMTGHREFFIAARLAYDPLITFGIAKAARIEDENDEESGTFTFADFLALTDKLYHRELTGHAARDAINAAALSCHGPTWNRFYRPVLLKDLKAGIEEKTINKVLTRIPDAREFLIPIFGCQLAHDGAKPENAKRVTGRKMLDVKLDGVRLLSVLDKEAGVTTHFTRNGKQNDNFSEIREALDRVLERLPGGVVLDGEVTALSFQDLMTQVNRREGVDTTQTKLALFDIIPLADFRNGTSRIPQEVRHQILVELVPLLQELTGGLVYVVPKVTVDLDTEEGQAQFAQFNKEAVEAGYEGIMVKDPEADYACKRTYAWLKIKPFIEVTLEVVGIEEGKEDGKYRGTTGALVCRGEDDGDMIETNAGSGLSDKQRAEIWADQGSYIGMMVEIRADAKTLERGSTVYSLRFPRVKGFRGTKPGEKL